MHNQQSYFLGNTTLVVGLIRWFSTICHVRHPELIYYIFAAPLIKCQLFLRGLFCNFCPTSGRYLRQPGITRPSTWITTQRFTDRNSSHREASIITDFSLFIKDLSKLIYFRAGMSKHWMSSVTTDVQLSGTDSSQNAATQLQQTDLCMSDRRL